MSYFRIIASLPVFYILFIQHGTANNCTCVKHGNNSYTFKLSSPGRECEEKTWNSQNTVLSNIEESNYTVILKKGDDFICTRDWVLNVTYIEECLGASGNVKVTAKCPENQSDCDYIEPSPIWQDISPSVKRQRWGLVAVALAFAAVLLISTSIVLISRNSLQHRGEEQEV